MPVIKINEGTQRWMTEDFTGGINQYIHPTKIQDNEFPVFENLILRSEGNYGSAIKRPGIERYNTTQVRASAIKAIGEYISQNKASNVQRLLCNTADGYLKYTDYASGEYQGAWTSISTAEADAKLKYLSFKDNLYISNRNSGADVNKFYDGTNYLDMGAPPCRQTFTPTAAGSGGLIEAGARIYIITYLYGGDEESFIVGRLQPVTTVATDKVTITNIPTGNARVTARKVYRSKAGNDTEVYFLGIIDDNTATSYVDTISDADLGSTSLRNVTDFAKFSKPYRSKYQLSHLGRIVQLNVNDDFYSPLTATDITLTGSDTGGNLGSGVYKYRFRKAWFTYDGYIQETSNYVEKTIDMGPTGLNFTGTDNSVAIAINATISNDPWFYMISIERTAVGGSTFKCVYSSGGYFYSHPFSSFPFTDTIKDTGVNALVDTVNNRNPKTDRLYYQSLAVISETDEPNIFLQGNVLPISDDEFEIKGGFSRYRGIDIFKERSIHRIFTPSADISNWEETKLVEGIGASWPESIVQTTSDTYTFCMKKKKGSLEMPIFYFWDGNGSPDIISNKIQAYLNTIQFDEIDGVYDEGNNTIIYTFSINGSYKGEQLIYDPNKVNAEGVPYEDWKNGQWLMFKRYTADLELRCPFITKAGKLLYGHEQGYIYIQGTGNQDRLGAAHTATNINVRLQTKTMEISSGDLKIKKLLENVVSSGAGAANGFVIYTSVNGSESAMASPPTLASGENRLRTGVNINAKKFYVRYENAENINIKFSMIGWDFAMRHVLGGGR